MGSRSSVVGSSTSPAVTFSDDVWALVDDRARNTQIERRVSARDETRPRMITDMAKQAKLNWVCYRTYSRINFGYVCIDTRVSLCIASFVL